MLPLFRCYIVYYVEIIVCYGESVGHTNFGWQPRNTNREFSSGNSPVSKFPIDRDAKMSIYMLIFQIFFTVIFL